MSGMSSAVGFVAWEAESSFADSDDDTVTDYMQIRDDQIDVSGLQRPLVERGGVYQYLNGADLSAIGPYGVGEFSLTFDLYGHGSATTGALTQTALCKLLGHVFGNANVASSGTTAAGTWTSAADSGAGGLNGGGFPGDGLMRIGALGDGRGEGQFYAVDTYSSGANSVTLKTAASGAPVSGDVCYATQYVFPVSAVGSGGALTANGSSSNNTIRFQLVTGNLQWVVRGCACTGVSVSGLSPGEIPQITLTFGAAFWEPISVTFPNTSATIEGELPAAVANGSLFVQDYGTTTRATYTARSVSLNIGQGMQPVFGPGGENAGQTVVGWRRVPAKTTFSFQVEADAATTSPTWWAYHGTDPNSQVYQHILWTASINDGSAIGVYMPKCKPIGSLPTQTSVDGLNYVEPEFEAVTNAGTAELERANFVLGLG